MRRAEWQSTASPHIVGERVSISDFLYDVMADAAFNVRPSDRMLRFYNRVGRLSLFGTILLLLTSIDTWRIIWRALVCERTDSALQIIYRYRFRSWRLLLALGDHLWQSCYNCRSVRARGYFVREVVPFLIDQAMLNRRGSGDNTQLQIVALGSGSAIQLLQGVASSRNNNLNVLLVDRNNKVLEDGIRNAMSLGIEKSVTIYQSTIGKYLANATKQPAVDIIEMVGILDYFDEPKVQRYLKSVFEMLRAEGFFLGSNISSTEEYDFAHGAGCWPRMFYRSQEKLQNLLREAGFSKHLWAAECGLYTVWVAQK